MCEKARGCNFMKCESSQCRGQGVYFCYICGHYSHFPNGPYEYCCVNVPQPARLPPSEQPELLPNLPPDNPAPPDALTDPPAFSAAFPDAINDPGIRPLGPLGARSVAGIRRVGRDLLNQRLHNVLPGADPPADLPVP
ncbi:unnamed protein product [Vitrella brassicaformis CCMP3155]|uniref:Uncharacterized protein n=1 Tax=Vitrella brassicaformis (strain CCMP3155) TaxID=1169540 RepID=A0A0G4H593_VITBC|nr:unnamed protein product [Vitrella brassicaformis CCMP3155]|eukprot:CEM38791.1 unnamed protein product [Vitrella brassicaformis CCMP3155]